MTGVLSRIAREALWAPVVVIVAHWLAGEWFGHEPVVDPVMHFSGGVAAAYFIWHSAVCAQRYLGDMSLLALGLLAFAMAVVAAVGWEFAEFVGDFLRGSNMRRGLANTMRDLFIGSSGAFAYVAVRGARSWRKANVRHRS